MSSALEYYEWLFLKSKSIAKWAESEKIDIGTQSIPDFFNICLQLVQKDINDPQRECFVKRMWEKGKKRLSVGIRVEAEGIRDYTTDHMIAFLSDKEFIDTNGQTIPYYRIRRIVVIPEKPKYSYKNIKEGMKLSLVNKRFTGNVYTVTGVHKKGFDVKNGSYLFNNLEYASIDKILKK